MIHDLQYILKFVIITIHRTDISGESISFFGKLIPLQFKFNLFHVDNLLGGQVDYCLIFIWVFIQKEPIIRWKVNNFNVFRNMLQNFVKKVKVFIVWTSKVIDFYFGILKMIWCNQKSHILFVKREDSCLDLWTWIFQWLLKFLESIGFFCARFLIFLILINFNPLFQNYEYFIRKFRCQHSYDLTIHDPDFLFIYFLKCFQVNDTNRSRLC